MIHIDASQTIAALKKLYKHLSTDEVNRAVSLAFNATMTSQRTFLRRHIQEKYPSRALRASGFNGGKGIKIDRASRNRLVAVLQISSKPLPLVYYGARQIGTPAKGQGVSVEVIKGKRKTIPFAFLVKGKMPRKNVMAKGHYQGNAFDVRRKRVRSSGADLPITTLVGPAVGKPDSSAMEQAGRNIAIDVPKNLGKFFQKISSGVVK